MAVVAVSKFIPGVLVGCLSSVLALTLLWCPSWEEATRLRKARIQAVYPGADVVSLPKSVGRFIVRLPDGSVRYVEAMNMVTNNEISGDTELISAIDGVILRKLP